jgi:hypothetical protein
MARTIVFETPGLIDLRSFTVMGLHAKPNSATPIGTFGTGLKLSVAVLLRHDVSPVLWIGENEHVFYTKKGEFRGSEYSSVRLKRKKGLLSSWQYEELPYTTDYGKFWKLWQVFRELHSNTLDENGRTYEVTPALVQEGWQPSGEVSKTRIVVESDEFAECFDKMDEIFLPGARRNRSDDQPAEAFVRTSKFLYWRGLKVQELQHEAVCTWNVLDHVELTEDRTLKHDFSARNAVARAVMTSKDAQLIERVLRAKEKTYEHDIDFNQADWVTPSPAYLKLSRLYGNKSVSSWWGGTGGARYGGRSGEVVVWERLVYNALKDGDYSRAYDLMQRYRDPLLALLDGRARLAEYGVGQATAPDLGASLAVAASGAAPLLDEYMEPVPRPVPAQENSADIPF